MTEHAPVNDADGMAALGICESLLVALTDLKIIGEKDARDLLTDVATAHSEAAGTSLTPDRHQAVVGLFDASSPARTAYGIRVDGDHRVSRQGLTGKMFAPISPTLAWECGWALSRYNES